MVDHIHLDGAEDVRRAGGSMVSAADTMQRAASQIDSALDRHQRFLDDWLSRFDAAIERLVRSNDDAEPSPMLCVDCGTDTGLATAERSEYYMVEDDVWAATGLGPDDGFLCIGCLEKRIGRELTPTDFKKVPINTEHYQHLSTQRLRDRLGYNG